SIASSTQLSDYSWKPPFSPAVDPQSDQTVDGRTALDHNTSDLPRITHLLRQQHRRKPLLRPLSSPTTNFKKIINILIESGRSRSRWRLQAFRSRTSFLDIAQTVRTHLDPMLGED
ncbi:unnamed protein product, partial [Ascophyllum nodosum]